MGFCNEKAKVGLGVAVEGDQLMFSYLFFVVVIVLVVTLFVVLVSIFVAALVVTFVQLLLNTQHIFSGMRVYCILYIL